MSEFTPNDSGAATEIDTIREPGARSRGGVVGWMSRHPVILAVLGLLVVLALGVFAFSRNAENRYQKMIREIRARGEPTTVEELIAATPGLPSNENQFLRAMALTESIKAFKIDDDCLKLLPYVGTADFEITGTKLAPEQAVAVRAYLNEQKKLLVELHAALSTGHGEFRPVFTTPLINTLLPELSNGRTLAKVLALCVRDAADRGDAKTATDCLIDMYRFSAMWDGKRSMLIGALVKITILDFAFDATERVVNANLLTEESLATISRQVDAIALRKLMHHAYITERVMMIDLLEWMKQSPGNTTSFVPSPSGMRLVPGITALNGAEILRFYEAVLPALDGPTKNAIEQIDAVSSLQQSLPWYQFYARTLAPVRSMAIKSWVRCEGKRQAMLVAIACERYRLKHGTWPEKLDALVPEFLDAVPLDPFDEKPIRFARIPEGIKVWSIGEDFVDNGGDVRRLDPDPKKRPTDWGWVILDPPLRNRSADATATTRPAGP